MSIPTQAIPGIGQAIPGQQVQGFPPPLGIEQALGTPYGVQSYPPQLFQPQHHPYAQHQQLTNQVIAQLLPVVHQMVTTQVFHQVRQLIAQFTQGYPMTPLAAQQYPQLGWQPWGNGIAATPPIGAVGAFGVPSPFGMTHPYLS